LSFQKEPQIPRWQMNKTNLTFVYSIRNNVLFTEKYYSNTMTMRRHIS
jgi:hypothetical protein